MERPFDYPHSSSDIVSPDVYDLKRANDSAFNLEFERFGGHIVRVTGWYAPDWWDRKDIEDVVAEKFPNEHCYHGHDCCGHYYPEAGKVLDVIENINDDEGRKAHLVLIRIRYTQNV